MTKVSAPFDIVEGRPLIGWLFPLRCCKREERTDERCSRSDGRGARASRRLFGVQGKIRTERHRLRDFGVIGRGSGVDVYLLGEGSSWLSARRSRVRHLDGSAKSKRKESYQCGGRDALALFLEYPTAAAASSACNLVGARLWGGNAPTRENPDELLTKDGTLVIVSASAIDDLAAKLAADGYAKCRPGATSGGGAASVTDDLKAALDCGPASNDPLRAWCAVAAEPSSGFNFPTTPTTYVGITAAVKSGTAAKSALLGDVSVSAHHRGRFPGIVGMHEHCSKPATKGEEDNRGYRTA